MLATPHFHAADDPELVRTPAVTYASILGAGSPGTDEFYRKKALIGDIARQLGNGTTPVIEIQYWYPEGSAPVEIADFYSVNPVPSLRYRVLAAIPDDTTADDLNVARTSAASPSVGPIDDLELFTVPEHDVVQVMHHGPFAEEFSTLARLGTFARTQGSTEMDRTTSSTSTVSNARHHRTPCERSCAIPSRNCSAPHFSRR